MSGNTLNDVLRNYKCVNLNVDIKKGMEVLYNIQGCTFYFNNPIAQIT